MSRNRHIGPRPHHAEAAKLARASRGEWFLACMYPSLETAKQVARNVRRAARMSSYEPAGAFQGYAALTDDGGALWVRYIAGDATLPDFPDTMTVRVCDRGDGKEYVGLCVVTVTISTLCVVCGGPRGYDAIEPYRFHDDGEWYNVDRWTNRCGHVDAYANVLRESRAPRLARFIPGPPQLNAQRVGYAGEVAFILTASANTRYMRAKTVARLLEEAGHKRAAELVLAENTARGGHMSAQGAAHHLKTLGGGR